MVEYFNKIGGKTWYGERSDHLSRSTRTTSLCPNCKGRRGQRCELCNSKGKVPYLVEKPNEDTPNE